MAISQNVRFLGEAAPDEEFQHPPGASIARLLKNGLSPRGWQTSEIENWRDSGWSLSFDGHRGNMELVVAQLTVKSEWLVQIAPTYVPGLLGRLLGRVPSATAADVLALAKGVYEILSANEGFGSFKWYWDGYPEEGDAKAAPTEPEVGG